MGGLGAAGGGCQELDNLLAVIKHRQSINNISTKFYVFPLVLFRKAQIDAQTFLSAHDSSFRACLKCPWINLRGQNRRGRPPWQPHSTEESNQLMFQVLPVKHWQLAINVRSYFAKWMLSPLNLRLGSRHCRAALERFQVLIPALCVGFCF